MAIITTPTFAITQQSQRSYQVTIWAPFGGDHNVTAFRELLGLDASGAVHTRAEAPSVHRAMSALGAEPPFVCKDGTSITIAHLLEAIPGLIDRWAQADAAAPHP